MFKIVCCTFFSLPFGFHRKPHFQEGDDGRFLRARTRPRVSLPPYRFPFTKRAAPAAEFTPELYACGVDYVGVHGVLKQYFRERNLKVAVLIGRDIPLHFDPDAPDAFATL